VVLLEKKSGEETNVEKNSGSRGKGSSSAHWGAFCGTYKREAKCERGGGVNWESDTRP